MGRSSFKIKRKARYLNAISPYEITKMVKMTIVEIGVYLKFDSIPRGSCNRPYLQGILSKKHWVQRRIETEREYTTQALIRKTVYSPNVFDLCQVRTFALSQCLNRRRSVGYKIDTFAR